MEYQLRIACLFVVVATSLAGWDFTYVQNEVAYVEPPQINVVPPLKAFTACFWTRPDIAGKENGLSGTFVSYAVPNENKEIRICNLVKSIYLYIGGVGVNTGVDVSESGDLHHVCVQWQSDGGAWKVHKDGVQAASGSNLNSGKLLKPSGSLIVGVHQSNVGSGFVRGLQYVGEIAVFNMYSRILSDGEISLLYEACDAIGLVGEGDIATDIECNSCLFGPVTYISNAAICPSFPGIPNEPQNPGFGGLNSV